jgi:hypothetical protein
LCVYSSSPGLFEVGLTNYTLSNYITKTTLNHPSMKHV